LGLLPQRKLALAPRFVAARLAVALVPSAAIGLLGLWGLGLAALDVHRLRTQDEIVARGVAAEHPRVDIVRDAAWMMFRARRYEVAFEDAEGRTHARTLREHDLSISPLVVEGPPEVHYDPADPRRVAVGFARQNVPAQWAAVMLLGTLGALAVALGLGLFVRLSRPLRAAWRSSVAREEKVARVVAAVPFRDAAGAPTGALQLRLSVEGEETIALGGYREAAGETRARGSGSGSGSALDLVTAADDPPLYLDASQQSALVVVGPGAPPVVVRQSGHPFVLSPRERAELEARVGALRASRAAA
jgi:hypothetical protein